MGRILAINEIADRQAKEITYKVQKKRELNEGNRAFEDILQEEIDKYKRGDKV